MTGTVRYGVYEMDEAAKQVRKNGLSVRLGDRALSLFAKLAAQPGELVSKATLLRHVWPDLTVDESNLRVHISELRRLLDTDADQSMVVNVTGRGYSLVAVDDAPDRRQWNRPLPLPIGAVFGREDAVAELAARLRQARMTTILGPAGMGKTTLAVLVAEAARAYFPSGVHFVDLASTTSSEAVAATIASSLDIPLASADAAASLTAYLAGFELLLVLDNCEHIADGVAAVAEWIMQAAPRVCLLATSREPVRADGEVRYRLKPLDVVRQESGITVGEALSHSAVALFAARARANWPDFAVTEANIASVSRIVRQLDGLPLAIELAAARIETLGVEGILERLATRFLLLTGGRRTALPRQQTLRAAFDWSFDLLDAHSQDILVSISLFCDRFTVAAANVVCAALARSDSNSDVVIDDLAQKSWLVSERTGTDLTYRMLESVRAYLHEKLLDTGRFDPTMQAYAAYLCSRFADADAVLAAGRRRDWLESIRYLLYDVRSVLNWAYERDAEIASAVRLTAAAEPLWWELGLVDEQRDWTERALAHLTRRVADELRVEMQLRSANGFSQFYTRSDSGFSQFYTSGPSRRIYESLDRANALATELGDVQFQLRTLWGQVGFKKVHGEFQDALRLAMRYYDIAASADVAAQVIAAA